MSKKYTLGIDYGSGSCRALLVDVISGAEIDSVECPYPHGIMEETLLETGVQLPPDWAIQHPEDYLHCLKVVTKGVMEKTGVHAEDIIGVGVDFTACTILPIDKEGNPLTRQEEFREEPHVYVKKWKHHAAQKQADRLNAIASERGEAFLDYYGGKVSSEWLAPKVMQILDESPEVYEATDRFIEAGDWIVLKLTGEEKRSSCQAGYKGLWNKKMGYPSNEFFKALDERLDGFVDDKLSRDIYSLGDCAGYINEEGAALTGLKKGTAVAVANIDAHVAVPAAGINKEGQMLLIMGTSTCHMVVSKEEKIIPGIGGIVEDGILPGMFGYEAGQACVGDHFNWFVKNCVPSKYMDEAKEKNMDIHQLLTDKASKLKVGESGLLALDWWNGNRSILDDSDLTGLILGCTLTTKPEEIYRALIEATAYGTKVIIDQFENNGILINELYASGGIAGKNALMMQTYADVTGKEIRICDSEQPVALGSCIFGAVAAGKEKGGYGSLEEAVDKMARLKDTVYRPIPANQEIYNDLYAEYRILHDYFGQGENNIMKKLKRIKLGQRS
ncbi:ribulokinase [Vallitalea okinawensis]|uniref:ribulokinase n=1 Tax=Vallitalea okinawensis TaxID=2078660 RepID=UPI000CFBA1CB|nr:ribulokinase [Vallitalea okinawensis]